MTTIQLEQVCFCARNRVSVPPSMNPGTGLGVGVPRRTWHASWGSSPRGGRSKPRGVGSKQAGGHQYPGGHDSLRRGTGWRVAGPEVLCTPLPRTPPGPGGAQGLKEQDQL